MSAMRGSSGLGSAISSCMELSSVERFRDGLQAPCEETGWEEPVETCPWAAQRRQGTCDS